MRTDIRLHDEDGSYLYAVTCDQNNQMIASKQAELHFNESGRCIGIKLVSRRTRYSRQDYPLNPPSTISQSELLANVGITKSEAPNYRAVAAAQEKVAAWPFVWDDRSAPAVLFT
jgi:hypothetical protein